MIKTTGVFLVGCSLIVGGLVKWIARAPDDKPRTLVEKTIRIMMIVIGVPIFFYPFVDFFYEADHGVTLRDRWMSEYSDFRNRKKPVNVSTEAGAQNGSEFVSGEATLVPTDSPSSDDEASVKDQLNFNDVEKRVEGSLNDNVDGVLEGASSLPLEAEDACPNAICPKGVDLNAEGITSTTHWDNLNMRDGPSTDYANLGHAPHGAPFDVLAEQDGWSFIRGSIDDGSKKYAWVISRSVSKGEHASEFDNSARANEYPPVRRENPTYNSIQTDNYRLATNGFVNPSTGENMSVLVGIVTRNPLMSPYWELSCNVTLNYDSSTSFTYSTSSELKDIGDPTTVQFILSIPKNREDGIISTLVSCRYRAPNTVRYEPR